MLLTTLTILLGVVAIVATGFALLLFWDGLSEGYWFETLIGFIMLAVAAAAFFGFAHFNHVERTRWSGDDTVVYTVMTAEDNTFLVTSGGKLLRCQVPSQCMPLGKGDHVTYQVMADGKVTLSDGKTRIADIKDVTKG